MGAEHSHIRKTQWMAYGGVYELPKVQRTPDGKVHIHGLVKPTYGGAVITDNAVIAKVPAGYEPEKLLIRLCNADWAEPIRMEVNTSGEIKLRNKKNLTISFVSLDILY